MLDLSIEMKLESAKLDLTYLMHANLDIKDLK
jgi:hypothetical protein